MKKYTQNFNEFLVESEDLSEGMGLPSKLWVRVSALVDQYYDRYDGKNDRSLSLDDKLVHKWFEDRDLEGDSPDVMLAAYFKEVGASKFDSDLKKLEKLMAAAIDEGIDEELTFVYDGVQINNPFMNDDGIGLQVDPTSYYGKHYTKAQISKVVNAMENLVIYYEDWKLSENGEFDGDVGDKLEEAYKQYKKAK